uniref:Uncharacterized protein n=1 Tax=Caenorhabditis japonica TaxID=281687 RepID=A0A8R1IGC9_CAEJA
MHAKFFVRLERVISVFEYTITLYVIDPKESTGAIRAGRTTGQPELDTADVDTCHILMRTIDSAMSGTTTATNFGII